MAFTLYHLDYMTPYFYCTGANRTFNNDTELYDDGATDVKMVFTADGDESVTVPYQCGLELRFYAAGTAPADCEAVDLMATTTPTRCSASLSAPRTTTP